MDTRKNSQVVPSNERKPHSRPPRSTGGLPDPNKPVRKPEAAPRQTKQSVAQPQPMQRKSESMASPPVVQPEVTPEQPKKKKGKGKFIALGVVGAVVVTMFGIRAYNNSKPKPQPKPEMAQTMVYEQSGRYALDTYLSYLKDFDADSIKSVSTDSWVAREWKYANSNEARQNWIKSVCAYLDFEYPQYEALDTNGAVYLDDTGNKVILDSDMVDGEPVTVTVVDFSTLAVTMEEDVEQIIEAYKKSGYSPKDYTYQEEMIDLMLDYLLTKSNYPTKTVEVPFTLSTELPVEDTTETTESSVGDEGVAYAGAYYITDDSALDKILFSSEEFHNMCDTYSGLIANYEHQLKVDEYNKKVSERDAAIKADKDALKKRLEDEEITQVEYDLLAADKRFTQEELDAKVAEENIRISEGVFAELITPKKQYPTIPAVQSVEEMFEPESVITYTWCGSYFCKNEYKGESNKEPQIGDGSFDLPAGVGTTIVTKALGSDGKFHDIKLTLLNYWTGEDAIIYAQKYSEKNRGWDKDSMTQLICYEIKIENLENTEVTIDSQMFLSDENSNKSSRTGSIFGFTESITLKPYETGYINDWATSTELPYKYVCWGSTFAREYPVIWFKVLAGSGNEIEDFDATLSYVGIQNSVQQDDEEETTTN